MGRGALATARAARRPRADRRGRLGAVPRRDGGRAHRRGARAPRGGAGARSSGCPTRSWRRGSRRSTTWAGPRPTSSGTTRRSRGSSAGSRSRARAGDGRLLVPMMLGKNFPFEMQGRLAEAIECCETALEAARLSASPHELYRALFELGWTRYYAGDLDGAIAACEESVQRRSPPGRGHDPQRRRRPGLGARRRAGSSWRGRARPERSCSSSAARTSRARCRSSAASTGRASRSPSSRVGERRGGRRVRRAGPSADAARLGPAAAGGAGRPRPRGGAARRRRAASRPRASAARSAEAAARSARGCTRRSRAACRGGRWRPRASGSEAIAALREAERELDACGSVRVRDELRRELRKLGARAEPRGPAAAGESGHRLADQARARDRRRS